MADKKGTLTAEADADLVILDESTTDSGQSRLEIDQVWKFGQRAYKSEVVSPRAACL
jgi:N-acetylglucosamine-6-phosphate deacetylase